MLVEFEGKRPQVHPEAFVAPTATLIGDVVVERGASIWYGVVLRADHCSIVVREDANVQDNSVVHGRPGESVEIGEGATYFVELNPVYYADLGRRHRQSIAIVED